MTALVLTVAYVALALVNAPVAAGAAGFYLFAVVALVMIARHRARHEQRRRRG